MSSVNTPIVKNSSPPFAVKVPDIWTQFESITILNELFGFDEYEDNEEEYVKEEQLKTNSK